MTLLGVPMSRANRQVDDVQRDRYTRIAMIACLPTAEECSESGCNVASRFSAC